HEGGRRHLDRKGPARQVPRTRRWRAAQRGVRQRCRRRCPLPRRSRRGRDREDVGEVASRSSQGRAARPIGGLTGGDEMTTAPLVIVCGALASELRAVLRAQGLDDAVDVTYLPANLHNRPERIVPELEPLLDEAAAPARAGSLCYADVGTRGAVV